MQHRFAMPPLEVEDFPQIGCTDMRVMHSSNSMLENTNRTDILQEILSVAQASHELMNHSNHHDTWAGNLYADNNDFAFINTKNTHDHANFYNDKSWGSDPDAMTSIAIRGYDVDLKNDRIVENLRWVGMSSEELEKVSMYLNLY